MNIVLICSNKQRKLMDPVFRNTPHTILANEPAIKGMTVARVLDHHVPHAVVLCDDVLEKEGITRQDMVTLFRAKRPGLRLIYLTAAPNLTLLSFLMENAVYDVISDYKQLPNLLDNPMTETDLAAMQADLEQQQAAAAEAVEIRQEVTNVQYEPLELAFPAVTAQCFDMDTVQRMVTSAPAEGKASVTIGIAQLQHHNGCTHTAFEIATLLQRKKKTVCIVLSDMETYRNLAAFHKLAPERIEQGLQVHGIDICPIECMDKAKEQHDCTICDFSFLREHQREVYGSMDVKLMLCSAAEWDIATTIKYINYPNVPYIRDIAYCFPRVSRAKFIGYSKQLIKSGCVAYRLHCSEDWLTPCAENLAVYEHLLRGFLDAAPKKEKRGLLRLK